MRQTPFQNFQGATPRQRLVQNKYSFLKIMSKIENRIVAYLLLLPAFKDPRQSETETQTQSETETETQTQFTRIKDRQTEAQVICLT